MTTALLDDAAEHAIRTLADNWRARSRNETAEDFIRAAWAEATEAAALKCDAIERENIEWIKRSGVVLSDGYKHADGTADGAAACAAAIRGGKL